MTVTLFGNSGDSGPRMLDDPQNNFERGQKDEFELKCPDLGEVVVAD